MLMLHPRVLLSCGSSSAESIFIVLILNRTAGFGGIFGWGLQLVSAYTVVDIDDVLSSDLGTYLLRTTGPSLLHSNLEHRPTIRCLPRPMPTYSNCHGHLVHDYHCWVLHGPGK